MKPQRLAALIAGLLLTACGGGSQAEPPSTASAPVEHEDTGYVHVEFPLDGCLRIGRTEEGPLRLCTAHGEHGTFVLGEGDTAELVDVPSPGPTPTAPDAGRAGHWAWAALSPDGTTLIAQWSGECESPVAFFVSLPAGAPRPATGELDWAKAPESEALGWTNDGRAIVFLPRPGGCGSAPGKPGVYAYDQPGAGERLLATHDRPTSPVRRSLVPRDEASLARG